MVAFSFFLNRFGLGMLFLCVFVVVFLFSRTKLLAPHGIQVFSPVTFEMMSPRANNCKRWLKVKNGRTNKNIGLFGCMQHQDSSRSHAAVGASLMRSS